MAIAAENGHSNILRYFFADIPQCRQSTQGPWNPNFDIKEHDIPEERRSAVHPDLVVLRTLKGAKPDAFQTLMDFGLGVDHLMDKIGSPLTFRDPAARRRDSAVPTKQWRRRKRPVLNPSWRAPHLPLRWKS